MDCLKSKFTEAGGLAQNRTGMQGFAVLCVTIPPRGLFAAAGGLIALCFTSDNLRPPNVLYQTILMQKLGENRHTVIEG
jgi:hypothetical protein